MDPTELYNTDEFFFCGTGTQVSPIGSVDKRTVGDGRIGPVTKKLQDLYFDVVKNKIDEYLYWCTKV